MKNIFQFYCSRLKAFLKLPVMLTLLLISVNSIAAKKDVNGTKVPSINTMEDDRYTVSGRVVDKAGIPLVGVSIVEKNTRNVSITNVDGAFEMKVSKVNATIIFSYIGFVKKEVLLQGQGYIDVVMDEHESDLNEIIIVGYGTQRKESITGAISSVSMEDLRKTSAPNLTNALAGRISGLTSLQSGGGQPGRDDASLYLRGVATLNGTRPLIVIDGVPRDNLGTMDINEVESISVLKDASATAVFGVRGANGAILVTTKRGKLGKPELNISLEQTFTGFTRTSKRLHSLEYFRLRQEALLNDKKVDASITPQLIEMHKNPLKGLDPNAPNYARLAETRMYMYPDHDYYNEFVKDYTPQTKVNANIAGGVDKITYFTNIGFIHQGGQFKHDKKSNLGYDPSIKMDRWSFRGNIDYKLSNRLTTSLNVGTYFQRNNMPHVGEDFKGNLDWYINEILHQINTMLPITPGPKTLPGYGVEEGQVVRPQYQDRSVYEMLNYTGYRREDIVNLNSSLDLKWDLGFITEGLSTRGMISYDTQSGSILNAQKLVPLYYVQVNPDTDEIIYTEYRTDENPIRRSRSSNGNYHINMQGYLQYARVFDKHDVGAMFLVQRDYWDLKSRTEGATLPYNVMGISGRVTYNYATRYFAEFNMGYNGSEQFSPNKRYGFFPAISGGWVISNESFYKKNDFVDYIKLRASWGRVGNDQQGSSRFLYLDNITMGGGFLESLGRNQNVNESLLGNYDITWEVADKFNLGLDVHVLDGLRLSFDYFKENRSRILTTRYSVPNFQGVPQGSLPKGNLAKVDNKGFEVEASYTKRFFGELDVSFSGNIHYNKNTIVYNDVPMYDDSYVTRSRGAGYSIGQTFGYEIDWKSMGSGYWTSEEEIASSNLAYSFGTPRVGDFRYIDQNGDGIVNEKDQVPIGYTNVPRLNYGLNLALGYKGFDFSIFFQGASKYTSFFGENGVYEYVRQGTYYNYTRKAWTQERWLNGEEITYPALGTQQNTNHTVNSFFVQDRSFLRLKHLEVGYTLPAASLKKLGVSRLRVYVSGQNIATWDNLRMDHQDPEKNGALGYPITKMYSLGFNVTF